MNSSGEKTGTFSIDGRTVTIRYTQEFLEQGERSSWLNVFGEFQLEKIETSDGTITIDLPGDVSHTITVKGEGGLTIEKTAAKRIDNENHKVYIDYTITLNAVRRNTNVKIEDVISAAMGEQNKNANILSWELKDVQGNGCTVDPDFFKVEDDKRSAGGTIEEMPAGSSVTVRYTIEVDCVGAISDFETVYSNEATASSDQTVEVRDEAHVSVLPVAIHKSGTLSGDEKTITWEIAVLGGEFESVSVLEKEFDESLQEIADDAPVTVSHGDGSTETISFIDLFGDGYTLKNDPKGARHTFTFETTLKEGASIQGVENKAAVQEPYVDHLAYVTVAGATLWKQVANGGHDIGQNRIDWKTTYELSGFVDAVAFEDYIDGSAGDNGELAHTLDVASVKLTYAVAAESKPW